METIDEIVRVMRAIDYGIIENPFVQDKLFEIPTDRKRENK